MTFPLKQGAWRRRVSICIEAGLVKASNSAGAGLIGKLAFQPQPKQVPSPRLGGEGESCGHWKGPTMRELVSIAERIAERLVARKQTIAVAESSTGGLISAALLAVPGASAYFKGSAVVYTRDARRLLMDIPDEAMNQIRSASEAYARLLAEQMRRRFSCDWGLSETGATGPSGNRYGDAAGHSCMAVAGTQTKAMTLETGSDNRLGNMQAFASTALNFFLRELSN
jgi:PncC family amidohydrolase